MSSAGSGRRASLSDSIPSRPRLVLVPHTFAKSVPETPVKAQRPVFHTVPDSPKDNSLLLEERGLDLSILTHKLQLYQLDLEEAALRRKHNRTVLDKHAAEVAAAARFRDELEKGQHSPLLAKMEEEIDSQSRSIITRKSQASEPRSRSSSVYSSNARVTRSRSESLRQSEDGRPTNGLAPLAATTTPRSFRTKRPQPLLLAEDPVAPQEIRSAALPTPRTRESTMNVAQMKKHWRRTTISAGRQSASQIILLSSDGKPEYCDFDVPPLPRLSASVSTISSPPTMSPMTPLPNGPTEDQIRRELETFALEEGPNIQMSRRSSVSSRKRMPVAFVPDPEDRMLPKSLPPPPPPPPPPKIPSAFFELADTSVAASASTESFPTLGRTKSFFSRFERKTDVDSVLDLYMTDDQLNEVKAQKKRDTRLKRQTFFKRLQPAEAIFHRAEKPG